MTFNTDSCWAALLGAEYYTEPDRDHFSNIRARINRRMTLPNDRTLNFGVAASAELDRPDADGYVREIGDGDNQVNFIGGYRTGPSSFTVRERLSDLSNDATASTTFAIGHQVDSLTSLSFEVTPISNEDAYIAARFGLSRKTSDEPDASQLRVDWAQIKYEYASASGGAPLDATEQTLLVSFQMRF